MDSDLSLHFSQAQAFSILAFMALASDDQKKLFEMVFEDSNEDILENINLCAMGLKNSTTYATQFITLAKKVDQVLPPVHECRVRGLLPDGQLPVLLAGGGGRQVLAPHLEPPDVDQLLHAAQLQPALPVGLRGPGE